MPIATLIPSSQYVGTLPAGYLAGIETPSIFGSVADGSDATFTQLEGQTIGDDTYAGILSVNFDPLPAGQTPTAMHMLIRARNGEAFPPEDGPFIQTLYFRVGETDDYDDWVQTPASAGQLLPLTTGSQAEFADYHFYFVTSTSEPNPATPDDEWLSVGESASWAGYNAWLGLTAGGGGLRFVIYPAAFGVTTRHAYLDIAEVRLIVAYDVAGGPRRRPLRQFPRSDGLGMSSARRQDANRSMQASLRRGGGVYF